MSGLVEKLPDRERELDWLIGGPAAIPSLADCNAILRALNLNETRHD